MARCDFCRQVILFGGVRDSGLRFCSQGCHARSSVLVAARNLPQHVVDEKAEIVHRDRCLKCQGNGPVDIHTSHRALSFLVISTWRSTPHVCCRSCGTKSQVFDLLITLVCGWWGIPWGLIMTPVQIVRNIIGMVRGPDPERPSDALKNIVRVMVAQQAGE